MDYPEGHKISNIVPESSETSLEKNLGVWEYDVNSHEVKWSDGFYRILGYEPQDIESSYYVFFEYLLYHEDKSVFLNFINNRIPNSKPTVQIRLLTKSSGYQWFESTLNRSNNRFNHKISGSIINIHQYKLFELKFIKKNIFSPETSKVVRIGHWELDPYTKALSFTKEFYDIYEYKDQTKIELEEFIDSFEFEHKDEIAKAIEDAIKYSKPFDLELLFKTANKNNIWVRIKGVSVIDDYGNCVCIKGILQDINKNKTKENSLLSSLNLLTDQNKRLQNFAYIISHNLRSHSGNLQSMITMYNETNSEKTKAEILDHIKSVSDSLTKTIEHVNEIVKIQGDVNNERKEVEFTTVFKEVYSSLKTNIIAVNAHIEFDFSKCAGVTYLQAYLESIFHNMLTNSLKYKHPDRSPHIKCYSYKIGEHVYLVFEDNGIGIDLAQYGNDVFKMYQTFHQNTDSRGIGLFLTRNQIEALGGHIDVESTVNVGTKFTIRLT